MANEAQAAPLVMKFTNSRPDVIAGTGLPSWSNELSVEKIEAQMRLMVEHGLLQKPQDVRELIWTATR